ncbi:hypothetical protein E4U41_007639, partial [Claviceps citrina]
MALPKTYQAVVLPGPNTPFHIQTLELKQPSPNQVLVKVQACGVCFSDVAVASGHLGTDIFPRTPGHEIVGEVVQVGAGVAASGAFRPGQR